MNLAHPRSQDSHRPDSSVSGRARLTHMRTDWSAEPAHRSTDNEWNATGVAMSLTAVDDRSQASVMVAVATALVRLVVTRRDLGLAAQHFLNPLRRNGVGLETQRQRILDRAENAPRLLEGTRGEVLNLTGDEGLDLDYYIYELARPQDTGRSIVKVFKQPRELLEAQASFDAAIPNLRVIRNLLTHPNDDDKLDEVAFFSSALNLSRMATPRRWSILATSTMMQRWHTTPR
jgi:hypothetical protein